MAHSLGDTKRAVAVPEEGTERQAGMLAVLRNSNFRFLWIAQLLSQLAQQMINFALFLQVVDLTGSSTAGAALITCFTVPGILFSAIAGVFVDRQAKRKVLILTNLARGIMMVLFVFTAIQERSALGIILPIVYVNTLLFSSISQFFVPAEGAMIPLLVKRNELIGANSLFNLTFTAAQLLGFAFLGPIVTPLLGYVALYSLVAVLYIVCAGLTWLLPQNEKPRVDTRLGTELGDKARVALADLKEGWAFIRRDGGLVVAITYWSVAIAVFMMLATMALPFLKVVLGIPSDQLSFILVPGGLGLLVGVVVVGKFSTERNRTRMIRTSLLAAAVLLFAFAITHGTLNMAADMLQQPHPDVFWSQLIMGVLAFFLGIANSFITVPAQTVLQERSPEHIRARVFSAFYTVSNTLLIIPILLASFMADNVGVVQTVVAIAILMILVVVVTSRLNADALPPFAASAAIGDAAEAVLPGNAPLPMDDQREHALNLRDGRTSREQIGKK